MWTYILLAIVIIVLICITSYFYIDWQVNKKIEQEHKERDAVEKRLTTSLKTLCAQLGIDLSYHKELFVDDARIEILEKYKDEPYTLAHELGHYMAIKQRQDSSEEGADTEADKLCRLILNDNEQKLLAISLRCYFH